MRLWHVLCCLCPACQVLANIRTERLELVQLGDVDGAEKATADWVQKCRTYLKRARSGPSEPAEVPKRQVRRKKAFEWLAATDNQWRGVGLTGWSSFQVDPDPGKRDDPFGWRHLAFCSDQGPDACAALSFLTRELPMNIDPIFCVSHACHNDTKLALKRAGLWPHQLLMVLAWRAWRGPWGSEDRYQQVQDTCTANFATLTPGTDPLFHSIQLGLLRDADELWRAGEPDIEQVLWDRLKSSRCFHAKGAEVSMTRFMGSIVKSQEEDREWHGRLYGLTAACLELGLLDSEKFSSLVKATEAAQKKHAVATADEAKKLSMKEQTEKELKAIRQAAKNAIHLSLMMYAEPGNQDRQRIIVHVSSEVMRFHQHANASCRDVLGAQRWLLQMCVEGLRRPCLNILSFAFLASRI